jgi:hypothetical protein
MALMIVVIRHRRELLVNLPRKTGMLAPAS